MRYYAPDNNRYGRRWAAAVTLLAYALCVALMLLLRFNLPERPTEGGGMLVDFGDTELAGGERDTEMTDDIAANTPHSTPDVSPQTPSENGDVEVPANRQTPAVQTPQTPPRTADPRALFPGRTAGSASPSQGDAAGAGNQGDPSGAPGGDGSGAGGDGPSFNLAGRSSVGALPLPDYNSRRQGRVVVEITVNPAGDVTSAAYRATGSVGVDNTMIQDAIRAARRARFNVIESDGLQTGTITYVFRMN